MENSMLEPADMEERARVRSSFYSIAALHFNERPTEALIQSLLDDDLLAAMERFAAEELAVDDSDIAAGGREDGDCTESSAGSGSAAEGSPYRQVAEGYRLMAGYLRKNSGRSLRDLSDELGVDRTRLYRGIAPGYGPEPPYETVWMLKGDLGNEGLRAVQGAYRDGGFSVSEGAHERADYLGIELEFCWQLVDAEAEAWKAGDDQEAMRLLSKERAFFGDHIGAWAERFADVASKQATTDFYRGHLAVVRGLMEAERDYLVDFD